MLRENVWSGTQFSGWLKKRQTRKRASSAREHVQFKKKDCGREVSISRDQRAHYPCTSRQWLEKWRFGEGKGVKEQLCDQPLPEVSGVAMAAI